MYIDCPSFSLTFGCKASLELILYDGIRIVSDRDPRFRRGYLSSHSYVTTEVILMWLWVQSMSVFLSIWFSLRVSRSSPWYFLFTVPSNRVFRFNSRIVLEWGDGLVLQIITFLVLDSIYRVRKKRVTLKRNRKYGSMFFVLQFF